MSFHAPLAYSIPDATATLAAKVFPKGNLYMTMCDELGPLYQNADFADLFPRRGQPALAPAQLLLVLVMQFVEGLSDEQAADAVRSRIDWKYALALELDDTGFDASVLSEFRDRLLTHQAEQRLLEQMLSLLRAGQHLSEISSLDELLHVRVGMRPDLLRHAAAVVPDPPSC